MMWRGIYLSKLPGLEHQGPGPCLDWTFELFFPRDIVQTIDLKVGRVPHELHPTRHPPWQPRPVPLPVDWQGAVMAALVGAAGGTLGAWLATASPGAYAAAGGILGLVVALGLRGRTENAGAGLIWGLGGGFLLWVVVGPASAAAHLVGNTPQAVVGEVQARIPELLACLLCMGAPVGIALGIRGELGPNAAPFHWGRAIVAGGAAGFAAALIFSRWMYEGDFFPLIAGLGSLGSQSMSVLLHVAVACGIGCTFGALFQNDVRNLGSSMGWGMAYAMFWWILGPMTVFPALQGQRPDWSASHASELFGPLVGYIFYGLILGVIYSGANSVWTRLFVDSDPLNPKARGSWDSFSGVARLGFRCGPIRRTGRPSAHDPDRRDHEAGGAG